MKIDKSMRNLLNSKLNKLSLYYETMSEALYGMRQAVKDHVEIGEPAFYDPVFYGQTKRYHMSLKIDGKEVDNAMLVVVLFRMESGKYELTSYVS